MKTSCLMKSLLLTGVALFLATSLSLPAFAGTQIVNLSPAALGLSAGQSGQVELLYDVQALTGKTTGLGLRIHFNSSVIEEITLDGNYGEGLIAVDASARDDLDDFDSDPLTDKYLGIAWVGVAGDWPSFMSLPLVLSKATVKVRKDCPAGSTVINLSSSGTPVGFVFQGHGATIATP
jgi:hypothetical protein